MPFYGVSIMSCSNHLLRVYEILYQTGRTTELRIQGHKNDILNAHKNVHKRNYHDIEILNTEAIYGKLMIKEVI